jgi:hypothetical protein
MKLEPGMIMWVKLRGREDRDLYIAVTRALSAPGSIFEIVSDTEVLCKPPPRRMPTVSCTSHYNQSV